MSNFDFLKGNFDSLYKLGKQAESYLLTDTNASMFKMRLFGEQLIDLTLSSLKIDFDDYINQKEKINLLRNRVTNKAVADLFDIARRLGNSAVHTGDENKENALECLKSMAKASAWFYVNKTKDKSILPLKFKMPASSKISKKYDEGDYSKEKEELKDEHKNIVTKVKEEINLSAEIKPNDKELKEIESTLDLNEAQTRQKLIDLMLKDAGWDINDSEKVKIEYKLENYKEEGKTGYADYVLFDKKGKPIGVVEAKKTSKDAVLGRHQGMLYADALEKKFGVRPVIFYTNGYEVYIWDDKFSEPRQIWGFYTLDDLDYLMFQHKHKESLSSVQIDHEIAGRHYQIEGIKRVYERFEEGKRKSLLVMATGTGKTRTAIALTKGMMKVNWAKRVLFLADRDELVKQAKEDKTSFKTFMPKTPSCRLTGKTSDNREASLYFSTYQTMINHYRDFSVGFFDLIICDESHRSIYQVYREILDYFDAHILGLTATPVDFINRNTFNLFNCENEDPTFNYSIYDAWDHVPPHLLEPRVIDTSTDFLRKGIKWNNLTHEQKAQLEEDGLGEEQIEFEKEDIEKMISNKATNRFILRTLMEKGIKVKDYIGKTIIFAKNKRHANLLDTLFNEMYPQYKGKLNAVIYSDIPEKEDLINKFKYEDFPRIAISVDLMDTGIDVPQVVNLVFAKPIYSKVKFWQMIGRGTRRCDNLFEDGKDKEYFAIFDCFKNFEFFDMNPKGYIPNVQKTSMQLRFENKIKLVKALKEKGETQRCQYIIDFIKDDISKLPSESIEIKKNRKNLETLKDEHQWNIISENLTTKLMVEIAPLMQWAEINDNSDAVNFDNSIYRLMVANLIGYEDSNIREINNIMEKLSKLKLNLNYFDGKREMIKSLLDADAWIDLEFEKLEEIRTGLRDLMKYKGQNTNPFIVIDIKDSGESVKEISASSVLYGSNMEPYEKRVKKAIEEKLNDHMVIHKIRKGQKLSEVELNGLCSIFNNDFTFTVDELSKNTSISNEDIEGILRKFIGIDEEELNKRFEEFIQKYHNKMSANQMKVLEIVKNDIIKNKGISFASLYGPPYTNYNQFGVEGVFGKMADDVFELIKPYKAVYIS